MTTRISMETGLLKGKTAVVTGSNRGIGKAIVTAFARQGAHVWACARKPDSGFSDFLAGLAKETDVSLSPVYFDLANPDALREGAKTILAAAPSVDILVNNAGAIYTSLFQMTPKDKLKEMFEVNYFSAMALTQYIVKRMAQQKNGSIVNLSSSAAIEGNEGRVAYASSKAALISATKVLAKELAVYNIRVNAIAPGLTETDMMRNSTQEEALKTTLQRTCLKRVGRPEEIANVALFLASELSSFVTGQTLRVDGGM